MWLIKCCPSYWYRVGCQHSSIQGTLCRWLSPEDDWRTEIKWAICLVSSQVTTRPLSTYLALQSRICKAVGYSAICSCWGLASEKCWEEKGRFLWRTMKEKLLSFNILCSTVPLLPNHSHISYHCKTSTQCTFPSLWTKGISAQCHPERALHTGGSYRPWGYLRIVGISMWDVNVGWWFQRREGLSGILYLLCCFK